MFNIFIGLTIILAVVLAAFLYLKISNHHYMKGFNRGYQLGESAGSSKAQSDARFDEHILYLSSKEEQRAGSRVRAQQRLKQGFKVCHTSYSGFSMHFDPGEEINLPYVSQYSFGWSFKTTAGWEPA